MKVRRVIMEYVSGSWYDVQRWAEERLAQGWEVGRIEVDGISQAATCQASIIDGLQGQRAGR